MSEPYIGMITIVAFNFAPKGFAFCDGTLLQVSQNQYLFKLIGATYGGDGKNTFALPDLRGRTIIDPGIDPIGYQFGEEKVRLQLSQIPAHTHSAYAITSANQISPQGNYWGGNSSSGTFPIYGSNKPPIVQLATNALSPAGGDVPHENMPPFTVINFVIALTGYFPTRE